MGRADKRRTKPYSSRSKRAKSMKATCRKRLEMLADHSYPIKKDDGSLKFLEQKTIMHADIKVLPTETEEPNVVNDFIVDPSYFDEKAETYSDSSGNSWVNSAKSWDQDNAESEDNDHTDNEDEDNELNDSVHHELEEERVLSSGPQVIEGNRIVDVEYLMTKSMDCQYQHSQLCSLGALSVSKEKRCGLESSITVKCNVCHFEKVISTQERTNNTINFAAVWSTVTAGNSYSTLKEILSVMNIPPLPYKMFHEIEMNLHEKWKDEVWKSIERAGNDERENAIRSGQIHEDGVPWITVYMDGGWSHRSYGHKYTATSGVAAIIGQHTQKVLFLGIRNKYCCVCARDVNKGFPSRDHVCFKNWTGSSPAMEADILVEGFRKSIEMHGVKYLKFVADGDSNSFHRIQQEVPYGREVKKVFCRNHMVKNFGSALYKLQKDTQISSDGRKLLTKQSIKDLEHIVTKLIYINAHGDVEILKTLLENVPRHVFGDHTQCDQSYCQEVGTVTAASKIRAMESTGILMHIAGILQRFVISQAHKLIENETNNAAENFMSLVCKFNAGKRLNLTSKGSFEARSYISGLRYNEGANWECATWRSVMKCEPVVIFEKEMEQRQKRFAYDQQRRAAGLNRIRKSNKEVLRTSKEYGPSAEQAPLNAEEFESEKRRFLNSLKVTPEQIKNVERETVGQWLNDNFIERKRNLLTASNFGKVCRRRANTASKNLVKEVLYQTYFQTTATDYGKLKESVAIKKFEERKHTTVQPCGIFIDEEHNYLAATPDGLVGSNGLVEVKCLYKVHKSKLSLSDAIRKFKYSLCLQEVMVNGHAKIRLKRTHMYYYQIQGQLNIAKKDMCFFVAFINEDTPIHIEPILRDKQFWQEEMLPKLTAFYEQHILPEIIKKNSSR